MDSITEVPVFMIFTSDCRNTFLGGDKSNKKYLRESKVIHEVNYAVFR